MGRDRGDRDQSLERRGERESGEIGEEEGKTEGRKYEIKEWEWERGERRRRVEKVGNEEGVGREKKDERRVRELR